MQAHASSMEGAFPLPSSIADPHPPADEPTEAKPKSAVPGRAAPEEAPLPSSFTAQLLSDDGAFNAGREAARFGVGLGLAALYGVSMGARHGGKAFFTHAAGVPAALLAIAALGVPALYIVLALFDAPLSPPRMITAAARASARTGLVLAGLAPAAALFVVSSDRTATAGVAAGIGLFVAGAIGLSHLLGELRRAIEKATAATRATAGLAFLGFGVFAVALAARIWWATLPLLGGLQ
jgi:hypothetical protein